MAPRPATLTIVRPETATATPHRGWSLHRALVVAGFLAQLTALIVFLNGNLAGFLGGEAIPVWVAGLATAALVARETPRRLLAAGLAVAIEPLLVLLVFGAFSELGKPAAGQSYLALMLLTASLLLALPAGFLGWRGLRAGEALPDARAGVATRHGLFAIGATMLLLGLGVAGVLAGGAASGGAAMYDFSPAATARVVAKDFAYPASVPLQTGAITEIVVDNRDGAAHTFTYTLGGTTYHHDVPGGGSAKFLVKPDAAGRFQFWCQPHSSGSDGARTGMVGTLVVA